MGQTTGSGGARSPLGELIASERQRRSLSRKELAALVRRADRSLGTDAKTVERWELRGQEPQPAALRALAKVFGKSVEELTALARQDSAEATHGGLDLLELPPAAPADHEYVEAVWRSIDQLVSMEDALGGDGLAPLAVRQLRAARGRLDTGAYERGIERDFQAAVGELAELAGWLLHDAGQLDAARVTDHEALFLTRMAGDRSTELFVLANLSYLDTSTKRPGAALQIARSLLCPGDLSNRLQAIFGIREARALAMLGDRAGSMRAIQRTRSRFYDGATASDPQWSWWITEAEVISHTGRCYMDLGEHATAIPLLQRAVEAVATGRVSLRFTYLTRLLGAMLGARDWTGAENVIQMVLPYVGEVGSARTAGLLRGAVRYIETDGAAPRLVEAGKHLGAVLTAAGYSGSS